MTKLDEINIPIEILNRIDENNYKLYIECSGGFHSSSIVLKMYELGFTDITLVFAQTYLEFEETLENIDKIIEITKYDKFVIYPHYTKKYPNLKELLRYSFSNIEKIKNQPGSERNKNYRDFFPCCKILKKYPMSKIHKVISDNSLIFSGLTPYESFNRYIRLRELRNKNTFFRFHKTQNILKCYPFRDLIINKSRIYSRNYFDMIFIAYLKKYNLNISHSGCKICPIRVLFPKMLNNNDCSLTYYNKIMRK